MPATFRKSRRKYLPWQVFAAGRCTFTIGVEGALGANIINVVGQFKNDGPGNVNQRIGVWIYLSDDANGDSIVATAPSGGWAIGTNGLLVDLNSTTAKRGTLTSEADGSFDISITEAGVKTVYLIVVMPDGSLAKSGPITWA